MLYAKMTCIASRGLGSRSIQWFSWQDGLSPEASVDSFPVLKLEEVFGTLAFYLEHKQDVEDYLHQGEAEFEALRARTNRELKKKNPVLYQKLMEHKNRKPIPSGSGSR